MRRSRSGSAAGEETLAPSDFSSEGGGGTITNTVVDQVHGAPAAAVHGGHETVVTHLLKAVPRAIAQALRLLFNNPREVGLRPRCGRCSMPPATWGTAAER